MVRVMVMVIVMVTVMMVLPDQAHPHRERRTHPRRQHQGSHRPNPPQCYAPCFLCHALSPVCARISFCLSACVCAGVCMYVRVCVSVPLCYRVEMYACILLGGCVIVRVCVRVPAVSSILSVVRAPSKWRIEILFKIIKMCETEI
jgi:hypothetical protein